MSGKGKEVECCGEGRRKPVKRPRGEEVTGKGKEVQFHGGKPEDSSGKERKWFIEDGKAYPIFRMNDRELNKYMSVVTRSGGYDVPSLPNRYVVGGIVRVDHQSDEIREELDDMAKFAIGKYNEEQSTRLELKKVKKATSGPGTHAFRYHITFDVLDPDDDAKRTKVFQAKLDPTFNKEYKEYDLLEVRPKPTAKTTTSKKKGQDKADQVRPKPTAKTTTSKKKGQDKADQVRPKPTGAA